MFPGICLGLEQQFPFTIFSVATCSFGWKKQWHEYLKRKNNPDKIWQCQIHQIRSQNNKIIFFEPRHLFISPYQPRQALQFLSGTESSFQRFCSAEQFCLSLASQQIFSFSPFTQQHNSSISTSCMIGQQSSISSWEHPFHIESLCFEHTDWLTNSLHLPYSTSNFFSIINYCQDLLKVPENQKL